MLDKDKNSEEIDADILQCKEDILRARDIMPPFKKKNAQKPKQKTNPPANVVEISTHKEKTTGEDRSPIPIETTKQKVTPLPEQKQVDIPKFDLAEEIMAEQRKISAVRRKGPGKKAEPELQLQGEYNIRRSTIEESMQNWIISEIVVRDIKRLCQGNSSDS